MAGSVKVELSGGVIIATFFGQMNKELVKKAQDDILRLLEESDSAKILYNTLEMSVPAVELAFNMKTFDDTIRDKIKKSATVVPGPGTAFKANIAFILANNHKIFYNNLQEAVDWLKS